jgi:YfiH family protein
MFMPEVQPNGAFEWTQASGPRALRCRPLLQYAPHLFTTRDLQLRGDAGEWIAVAGAVGVDSARLRLIRQVHGIAVAVSRAGGAGSWDPPQADIIVSDDPEVAVGVRVADCAPVLIADTVRGVVAAAHAGWRGTAQSVASHAVGAMGTQFGSKPEDLIAAIGPCLGPCCGEVGPDVLAAFRSAGRTDGDIGRWFRPGRGDRHLLDLARANVDQLAAAGVPLDRIYDSGLCTKSHAERFHSYRADGPGAGRMAAVIRARKNE